MGGRKQAQRDIKPGVYILGEGKTEQYYFHHLKSILRLNYTVKPRLCKNSSIDEIDKKISELVRHNVYIICIFDLDVINRDNKEKIKYDKLVNKYKKIKNILFSTSLPSIEYWFLLHHKDTNKHFKDSEAVTKELRKYIKDYEKEEIYLKKSKWVEDLLKDNKLEKAIERASKNNDKTGSHSNIHKAIKKVSELRKKEI